MNASRKYCYYVYIYIGALYNRELSSAAPKEKL